MILAFDNSGMIFVAIDWYKIRLKLSYMICKKNYAIYRIVNN